MTRAQGKRKVAEGESASWLVILSEAEGLHWVLANRRMAFSEGQTPRAREIRKGDRIFLYVSRGAFHNPTRDHSQLLGIAAVLTDVVSLREPVVIRERSFVSGCRLKFERLLPEREGILFRPLVPRLKFIRVKATWSAYMRQSLIRLSPSDAAVLDAALVDAPRVAGKGA